MLKGFCRGVGHARQSPDVESARISPGTRARVREVADRLGYVPNRLAQGLRFQRSGTIGFVGDQVATTPYAVGGAVTAVGELIGQGHRRIAFINNTGPTLAATGRLEGYRRALEEAGIEVDPALVVAVTDIGPDGGYQAARQLLALPRRPTAVFCFRDLMAMGVYRAALEARLEIPRDLPVVGFDDMEGRLRAVPRADHVALPHYEMGTWGVQQLLTLIDDTTKREAEQVQLSGQLIRRRSVAPRPSDAA